MDWPNSLMPPLPLLTPFHPDSIGPVTAMHSATASPMVSGAVTTNQAYLYPFRLDRAATAKKMFVLIGAAPPAGNIDLGIYDAEFNKIVSLGATAIGAASTIQEGDITDTALPPGLYWMAFSSSAACTVFRTAPADEIAHPNAALYMMASAHVLPTTITPAKNTEATPLIICMGVSFDTLI